MSRWIGIALVAAIACNHSSETTTTTTTTTAKPGSGSGSGSGSEDELDRDLPRLAQLGLAMYKDLAAAFASAGTDCKAATAKLDALAVQYKAVVAANAKVLHDHRAKEMRAALAPYQADLDTAGQAVMASKTLETCSSDKAFETAFDRLVAPP